ncbi:MAG: hypothetical protein AAGF12_38220, partial [Myxococcota bacterium]
MWWCGAAVSVFVVAVGFFGPSSAAAHPLVDSANERYGEADFRGALALLASVEDGAALSREDLGDLLELRALVHLALSDRSAMEADLRRLRALFPDHRFRSAVPPSVRRSFAQVPSEPFALLLQVERQGGQVRAEVAVENDPELMASFDLRCEAADRGERTGERALVLEVDPSQRVECVATALGIGGAVLSERREEVAGAAVPVLLPEAEADADPIDLSDPQDPDEDNAGSPWP